MLDINNRVFIETIFGADAPRCHVTDFTYSPDKIPDGVENRIAWFGGYYADYTFSSEPSNQYFTISTFEPDEQGKARRRKSLYQRTHCIVLDDVKEKLVQSEVDKLPQPSWILETSNGSEQWGYILQQPSSERTRVENLLDGLIANGLAPDGKDSGMKGVTRYVRLPEGINNKTNKLLEGQPFKCRMLAWNPFNRTTLEALAEPLNVDLDASRRDTAVDGAVSIPDHPMFKHLHVKETRDDGRTIIQCPWHMEHTNQVDDLGTAVFTNEDGSIGFKCHHGHCVDRTGKDLLDYIESQSEGFRGELASWQVMRTFDTVADGSSTSQQPEATVSPTPPAVPAPVTEATNDTNSYSIMLSKLRMLEPNCDQARKLTADILKIVEDIPPIDRQYVHDEVREILRWSRNDFINILAQLRKGWYAKSSDEVNFYGNIMFIAEQNQFYDRQKRLWYTPEAFQNSFSHLDDEAKKQALTQQMVSKVDKLDFAPEQPAVFEDMGITYGNSWLKSDVRNGAAGDASPWLAHFDTLGWGEHKQLLLQWMAFTLRNPAEKINYAIILGGHEGSGKDFLLYPLLHAMSHQAQVIGGDELLSDFNNYLMGTKYLHVNETELGDNKDADKVSTRFKALAAAPPDTLRVNDKGVKAFNIRKVVNVSMTTNSMTPIKVNGVSRRMLALWSDLDVRGDDMNMKPEWARFWRETWHWMKSGGVDYCIDYLFNHVDLSDFDAGTAPPATEFMRQIVESSKSVVEITLDNLVRNGVSFFANDLVTLHDVRDALAMAAELRPELLYTSRPVTPAQIGNVLNRSHAYSFIRTSKYQLYAVRNQMRYRNMAPSDVDILYEKTKPERKTVAKESGKIVTFTTEKQTNE